MEIIFTTLRDVWSLMAEMAPYLLLGFLIAGLLSVFISPEIVERHLGGNGFWAVFKASLFGVPLPLCSCSVLPVAASLHRHGAGKGPVAAFLISTPQTGVDSIMATYSLLGPVFAVFRPVAAFVSGLIGGIAVNLTDSSSGKDTAVKEVCMDECCMPANKASSKIVLILKHAFVTLPRDLARPMIIGLIVAGIITVSIPQDFFSRTLGTGIVPMLVMMVAGIPIYVCATGSIPVAAAMIAKGITPGAALVFLMTGPAISAASIAVTWKMMGKKVTVIYIAAIAVTSLLSGIVLDFLLTMDNFKFSHMQHEMIPVWLNNVSGVILIIILAAALFERRPKKTPEEGVNVKDAQAPAHEHGCDCSRKGGHA